MGRPGRTPPPPFKLAVLLLIKHLKVLGVLAKPMPQMMLIPCPVHAAVCRVRALTLMSL